MGKQRLRERERERERGRGRGGGGSAEWQIQVEMGCDVVGYSLHLKDTNTSKQSPCKHSIDLRNIFWGGVCL